MKQIRIAAVRFHHKAFINDKMYYKKILIKFNGLLSRLFISLILLTSTARADNYIVGHMQPLDNEKLETPINLKCGMTIYEWRGGTKDISILNKYCSLALENFGTFIKKHKGIDIEPSLNFSMSLIPDTKKYRDLNDMRYRFIDRQQQVEVWGYTSYSNRYVFLISNIDLAEFKTVLVHEVFHAISMSSNVFDSHPGDKYEKYKADEKLARKFTRELGLGE